MHCWAKSMKYPRLAVLLLQAATFCIPACALDDSSNPWACVGQEQDASLSTLRKEIAESIKAGIQSAEQYCKIADYMKRTGDARTQEYLQKTIAAGPDEAAYELFYADYLRVFRGPNRPLFSPAEEHYFAALEKLNRRKPPNPWDAETRSRVQRGLIALYQEDGAPLAWRAGPSGDNHGAKVPAVFIASINRYASSTADLDREVDDIRDYTSEALISESRLNRDLTPDEFRNLVRTKRPFETLDRVRFRHRALPAFDVFYTHRQTPNDAVTSFFVPNVFNEFHLNSLGISAEKSFSVFGSVDANLTGTYKKIRQQGLIESVPAGTEAINDYEIKGAISRFIGPDKLILQMNYAYQAIHPELAGHTDRNRQFSGGTLTYQFLRRTGKESPYSRRFDVRSRDFFVGFLLDNESFTDPNPARNVTVIRRDYYAGLSLKQMGRFDLTIQPTVFSLSSSNGVPQSNSQYRTNVTLLGRIVDEEDTPGLPVKPHPLNLAFWHLVLAARHDVAFHNITTFENYKVGLESDWKLFTIRGRTTFLASVRYDFQQFIRIDEHRHIVTASVTMGF
jgi:hypothetical protein